MKSKQRLRNIILLTTVAIFIGTFVLDGNPMLDQIHGLAISERPPGFLACNWF